MKFIENIEKERYEEFAKKHDKSHFLQSYDWGLFAKKEKNLIPHYIGLEDDNNNLVATAMLFQKKLPLNFSYFYIPRGFLIDYKEPELIKEFTQYIKKYVKRYKAVFFKIDPDIIYKSEDVNGNIIKEIDNEIYNNLKKAGYKHLGFTKNFETMQPRYTFRIDLEQSIDDIKEKFSKTTKQRIKKAEELEIDVRIGDCRDIKTFYDLMIITENRKDFITHNEQYYKSLYEIWNKDNNCNIFLGSVNIDKIITKYNDELENIDKEYKQLPQENLSKSQNVKKKELEQKREKINNNLQKYNEAKNNYGSEIVLSAHFIIEYGNKAWVLYAGNHNILTDTYANYKTYEQHLIYCHNKKLKIYDQFGTIGDLRKENPLFGLHDFKRKFGGDYVEFIGEFDYIMNKPMYLIFTKLVPIYRNFIKNMAKRKNKR